jgi:hypothetical protein
MSGQSILQHDDVRGGLNKGKLDAIGMDGAPE